MSREFDILFCAIAFIGGFLLLIGRGDILLRDRNSSNREKIYDMKKVERASGIVILASGVLTLIDMFMTDLTFQIIYLVLIILLFAGLYWYITKKCKR